MTFWDELVNEAGDDALLAVVIGEMGWADYNEEGKVIPRELKGVVLTPEQARPLLDYKYEPGYGAPDCHCVYAYTASRVVYVSQYDGATQIRSLPRNPSPEMPEMPGG